MPPVKPNKPTPPLAPIPSISAFYILYIFVFFFLPVKYFFCMFHAQCYGWWHKRYDLVLVANDKEAQLPLYYLLHT
uniref:Uncharacterized protein n=1 Tax=Anguilla anguilla TaxID=7936 RepID=A0A0E9WU99_ANGAN